MRINRYDPANPVNIPINPSPDGFYSHVPPLKVYLCGPMSGIEKYNFPAFNAKAKELEDRGWEVFNPAFTGVLEGGYREYMKIDLPQILAADMIECLPGWEKSKGASLEVALAHLCDIPVFMGETRILPPKTTPPITTGSHYTTIFEEASSLVDGPREKTYGHPIYDFSRTAGMWSALFGTAFSPEDVALAMICVKMSRLRESPDHHDSLVDIAGYARTYEKVRERQSKAA